MLAGVFALSMGIIICGCYYLQNISTSSESFNIMLSPENDISKSKVSIYDIENDDSSKKALKQSGISIKDGHGYTI